MSDEFGPRDNEDTRLCPTCRMPISVLATRCRFCGETVGRPKKAEEHFTVSDLGGESKTDYTVSGDLMDAMESFRMEEFIEEPAAPEKQSKWFSRESKESGSKKSSHFSELEIPQGDIDEERLDSPSSGYATPSPSKNKGGGASAIPRQLFIVGAVAAGLVILYFGSSFTWAKIKDYLGDEGPQQPVYNNRAMQMLEAGEPTIDALEEAHKALDVNDTSENRSIAEEVRSKFVEEMTTALNAREFDRDDLDSISEQVSRAAQVDSSGPVQELMNEVAQEVAAYNFVLTKINREDGTATFKINNPNYPEDEQTVKEGDKVQDRFRVERISSQTVRLVDEQVETQYGERKLVAPLFSKVKGA